MTKTFVLDTNVLLHNAEAIESFADNTVVIPMAVIEELDNFKSHNDELGRNARQVIRRLDALRVKGSLRKGVPLNNGGILSITSITRKPDELELDIEVADNRILHVAYELHKAGREVVFVSKDINARLKADALGLRVVDFEKQKVNFDELYSGYNEITVHGSIIKELQENKTVTGIKVECFPNQFVILKDETNDQHTAIGRVLNSDTIQLLPSKHERVWNVRPQNREQRMAIQLLLDPAIQIVTLVGQAGTGKTLLALAAGLQTTIRDRKYDHVLVSRPIIPMGNDIGFLPGGKEEKLSHWMQPIFDNLAHLLRDGADSAEGKRKSKDTVQDRIENLIKDKTMTLEALTYIRGRSIPGQYVIIDEAQNLTPHEIKTVITRAGDGTKMVLTGDPYQIDNPYLDASSNGLTYAAERLKENAIHGHVTLTTSERSTLAAIAAKYL